MKSTRNRSKAEWQKIIEAWRESGLGVREFCRQRGLTEGRFYSCRKRLRSSAAGNEAARIGTEAKTPVLKFLPVQIKEHPIAEATTEVAAVQRVEVFLGNGAVVRFSGEMSADGLGKIMQLAAGASC